MHTESACSKQFQQPIWEDESEMAKMQIEVEKKVIFDYGTRLLMSYYADNSSNFVALL